MSIDLTDANTDSIGHVRQSACPQCGDELVSLSFPRRHLTAMVKALAQALTHEEEEMNKNIERLPQVPWPTEGEPKGEAVKIEWNTKMFRTLRREIRKATAEAILNFTSDHRDQKVYLEDIMQETGYSRSELVGGLVSLTSSIRRAAKIPVGRRFDWPMLWSWDTERELACYTMSSKTSDEWRASAH